MDGYVSAIYKQFHCSIHNPRVPSYKIGHYTIVANIISYMVLGCWKSVGPSCDTETHEPLLR